MSEELYAATRCISLLIGDTSSHIFERCCFIFVFMTVIDFVVYDLGQHCFTYDFSNATIAHIIYGTFKLTDCLSQESGVDDQYCIEFVVVYALFVFMF